MLQVLSGACGGGGGGVGGGGGGGGSGVDGGGDGGGGCVGVIVIVVVVSGCGRGDNTIATVVKPVQRRPTLQALQRLKVTCGYAHVGNLLTGQLTDR